VAEPLAVPGVVHLRSAEGTVATIGRLEQIARAHGLTIFARIDFARDAAAVGLALAPMVQLIFGNPRAGTPLLAASPTGGLELPLRALAWDDATGQSWLSYLAPEQLGERHQVPPGLRSNISALRTLCEAAVERS
jgi:uncharacterized protein (DUF302 family)